MASLTTRAAPVPLVAQLTSGSAFIDASRTNGRAVVVHTAQAHVDIGSATCEVNASAERTRIEVSHGTATLVRPDGQKSLVVAAGQRASVAPGGDPTIDSGARFVRGVNFGGDAVTIDGYRLLAHRQALKAGMELAGGTQLAAARSISAPGLDFALKSLLDCGLTASGPIRVFQSAPNGEYEVVLWISDDRGIRPEEISVNILNRSLPAGIGASGASSWRRLGPYRASVTNRRIEISLTGPRSTVLAGMAIFAVGPIEGGIAPYAALTIPGDEASFVSVEDIPLAVDVGTAEDIAKVVYSNGSKVIAESTTAPFGATWTHPTPGKYALTATVTTKDGASARTPIVSGVVEDANRPGILIYEYWQRLGNGSMATMRADPRFKGPPTGCQLVSQGFRTRSDFMDHFGARIRGYLIAPADGEYVFSLASDDNGEFWLGSDEKPASIRLLASVPGHTGDDQWDKYPSQTSQPVTLVKGRRYVIEALYTDGGGYDFLTVGWRLPDGRVQRPIPAACLEPYLPNAATAP
ncbi:MAG: hypothetical protein H0V44_02875 [Planctomycetes bacterium]|nr:hypothetical protein [Planctomycetota bacterium]